MKGQDSLRQEKDSNAGFVILEGKNKPDFSAF
jgi:hypothetical protein